jgi:hypothetical protein
LLKKQETERLLSQITQIKAISDIFDIESAFICGCQRKPAELLCPLTAADIR